MQDILQETYKDELTGVYNRKYLNLIFERELARSRRYKDSLSLMILDLDNFKEINDSLGHLEGDKTLVKFADVLKNTVRESDTVVRYGGDEFVIIIPSTSYEGAVRLGERILENLKKVNTPYGHLSASIGISTYPEHGVDFKSLFDYADRCLYDAKRSGKGRVGVYKDSNLVPGIPSPVLVGRREEKNYVIKASKEPLKIHFISGDAGIGKTRLLLDTLSSLNVKFAQGMAYGAITAMPYIAIRTLLIDMIRKYPVEFKEAYGKMQESSRIELGKLIPQLSSSQTVQTGTGDKFTLFAAVSDLFTMLSSKEPLVLAFDDLHWADELSLELVYYLLHMMLPNVVMFATYRNDEIAGTPLEKTIHLLGRERLYDELVLHPMTKGEVKLLSESILKRPLSPELIDRIYEFSGGNPFFVEEFIRTHFDAGALRYVEGEWTLTNPENIVVSRSIKDTIERKLEHLGNREKKVIRYGACAGKSFYPEIIARAMGMNVGEVYGILDKLVRLNILIESEGGEVYSFKEDAIRLVVLDDMGDGVKKVIYDSLARHLEEKYGVTDNSVEMVLHYYYLARNKEKLAQYGELAGDMALKVYAYNSAVKYYEFALQSINDEKKKGILHRKIGTAYIHLGRYEDALKHFGEALKYLEDERGDLEGRFIAYTYNLMGNRKKAIEYYRLAIEHTGSLAEKCGFKFMLAFHLAHEGNLKDAERLVHEALEELPSESLEVKALGYNTLATIYEMFNDSEHLEKAERYFMKALETGKKAKASARNMAAFYNNLGGYYARRGMFDKALPMFIEAKKLHEKTNFAYGKSMLYGNLAMLYMDMEMCSKSIECATKGIKINNAMGRAYLNIPLYLIRGEMYFELARYEEAGRDLYKVCEYAKENKKHNEFLRACLILHKLAAHIKINLWEECYNEISRSIEKGSVDALDAALYTLFLTREVDEAKKLFKNNKKSFESMLKRASTYNKLLYKVWSFVLGFDEISDMNVKKVDLPVRNRTYIHYLIAEGYRKKGNIEKSLRYIDEGLKLAESSDLYRLKDLLYRLRESMS